MSLVNDMLKDLDDRRRGPTRAGLGAEKLVSVTASHGAGSGLKKLISFVGLLMLAAAVVFLGMQYFRQSDGFPELPLAGVLQQALQASVERSSVVDTPMANAPAQVLSSAAPSFIAPAQSPEQLELAMIAKRMEELEAQNRALLEAQAQMATRVAAVVDAPAQEAVQVEQSVAQVDPFGVEEPSPASDASYIDPAFADALAIAPAVGDQAIAGTASQTSDPLVAQQAAAPMRSPIELSFADQDKGKTQEALTLWGRNQRAEAVALLQGFIDANSLAHQSRETLAKLMLQQNDIAAVTVLVQQGMAVAPEFVGYRKLQARLLLSGGMTQEAVRLLSDKPPLVSVDNEYHDLLATAQLSTMDFAGAAKSYQSLVQQNRNEARWWYGLAAAQDGLGRETEALQAYQQALSIPSLSAGLRQRSERRVAELGL
jgi:MSHA biogenesis protein MshN